MLIQIKKYFGMNFLWVASSLKSLKDVSFMVSDNWSKSQGICFILMDGNPVILYKSYSRNLTLICAHDWHDCLE